MGNKLLLITDRDLGIISKGNVMRIRNLIKAFSFLKYDIALICSGLSVRDELRKLCKEVVSIPHWLESGRVEDFSPEPFRGDTVRISTSFRPDIVIVEYAWMAGCFDFLQSPAIKVVDTHDLLYEHFRQYENLGFPPWVTCSMEEEKRLLLKADVVIAIQQEEQRKLQTLLPGIRIICIPHLGEVQRKQKEESEERDLDKQPVIGFIGSAHSGNRGILAFIQHGWPQIRQQVPGCQLVIAGSAGSWVQESDDIQIIPYAADVSSFYQSATVIICPIVMGTGLKIKLVEALLYGKATVTTSLAAEGLPPAKPAPYIIADAWAEFSEKVVQLLKDHSLRKKIEQDAYAYAEEYFSFYSGIKRMQELHDGREGKF